MAAVVEKTVPSALEAGPGSLGNRQPVSLAGEASDEPPLDQVSGSIAMLMN